MKSPETHASRANLIASSLRSQLLAWYDVHARALPWRKSRDAYHVWVSEIMLQQTRVAAVIEHYHDFLRRFPNVEKLAAAREASVLAAWSGLGYYRRARMLHSAAKVIVRRNRGTFPSKAAEWLDLPGVGRYTAAAIASIAFGEPTAVVDGNVERVLQRVLGNRLAGERIWESANAVLDPSRPGDFNQAMMELGAVVCTPHNPACLLCPLRDFCATRGELAAMAKPAPQKKREIHYALVCRGERNGDSEVFLVQRARNASLMAGMWELPEMKALGAKAHPQMGAAISTTHFVNRRNGNNPATTATPSASRPCLTLRHSITITDYTVQVWRATQTNGARGKWFASHRLGHVALTGLARKILRRAGILAGKDPQKAHLRTTSPGCGRKNLLREPHL